MNIVNDRLFLRGRGCLKEEKLDGLPKSRGQLALMWANMGLVEGAEVGVFTGHFSDQILREPRIKKLYSVDGWAITLTGKINQRILVQAQQRLAKHGARSEIVVCPSPAAASRFADGSLGFVYIDADHDYEPVKADLKAWWPKVRSGGCLSGHDYRENGCSRCGQMVDKSDKRGCGKCGVIPAVNEFVKEHGLELHIISEGADGSWWCLKP